MRTYLGGILLLLFLSGCVVVPAGTRNEVTAGSNRAKASSSEREPQDSRKYEPKVQSPLPHLSMEQFHEIQNGMTYEQVKGIMGWDGMLFSDVTFSALGRITIYSWAQVNLNEQYPNHPDANRKAVLAVTFQDNAVTKKEQNGLRESGATEPAKPTKSTPPATPKTQSPQKTNSTVTLGVSYDDILMIFKDMGTHFDMKETTPVEGETRFMGKTDDGGAYLEVIGEHDDVSNCALILGIPSDAPNIRARNARLCYSLLSYMFPDWDDRSIWFSNTLKRLQKDDELSETTVQGDRALEVVGGSALSVFTLTVMGKDAEKQ